MNTSIQPHWLAGLAPFALPWLAAAQESPVVVHAIFIPLVMIVGGLIGYAIGKRSGRSESIAAESAATSGKRRAKDEELGL